MRVGVNSDSPIVSLTGITHFDETIQQLLIPYGQKEVYRAAQIGTRQESVCEHIGSMLTLARWFMRTYDMKLDLGRVVDIICYHDLPELESGDTPIIPGVDNRAEKETREASAAMIISERMTPSEGSHFLSTLAEYKEGKTREAKFVRAIDKLDADLQFLGNKDAWKAWSDEFYRSKREPYYREVPEISEFYDNLLNYLRSDGYLKPSID
jgi:5'-deoxynucleotidase YfbR-like HD superfamily hydrolase